MAKHYICYHTDDGIEEGVGKGGTLKEAYEDFLDFHDGKPDDCTFLECEEVQVEVKIQRKEVVTKIAKAAPKCL